jgi:hypothetical protein
MWDISFQLSGLSQFIIVSTDTNISKESASSFFRFKVSRASQKGYKSKFELYHVLLSCLRNTYLGMNKTGNVTWRGVRVTLVALENTRNITHSKCVSKALFIQHVKRMRRTMLSSVACLGLQYYPVFSHKLHDLQNKKFEHKICVWILSASFFPKYFSF